MTRLRVALRVPVGRPLPDLAAFIARCEDAGFDGVGIHDHPSSGRDAYLALALAAQATQRLRLFPATSSPVVRHPLVLASLAHSLEEIAPGRIVLTVAPGFISTRSIGQPRAPVAVMREAIGELRRLLAGEAVEFGSTTTRLRNRSATPTPVYMLAAGPRMIELAGEIADGAFLMVGLHPAADPRGAARISRRAPRAPAARWPTSRWCSWPRSASATTQVGARWVRSWFAPGQPFLAYPSASNLRWLARGRLRACRGARSRRRSPRTGRVGSPMRSGCSARRSAAPSACCRRARKPASRMCSCSRRMTSPAGTRCRRRRCRLLQR